jgi:hypothetical protein
MNIKSVILLVMTFAISACEQGADLENTKFYSKSELSFNYPGNWSVSEDSVVDDVRFIFIESPGAGMMKIEIYNEKDAFELRGFAELDIDALIGEMYSVIKITRPKSLTDFEKKVDGKIFKGLMYEMNMTILGLDVPHVTEVFMFMSDNKSAYLSSQVAIEDRDLVSGGFELIYSSFVFN